MKLIPELFSPNLFTLMTAPVAKGKTKLIVNYYLENQVRVVFVSPLRALANEVYSKLKTEKGTYLLGGEVASDEVCINFLQKKKAFLVTTMELLTEEFLDAVSESAHITIFVLDEFHLFYHWGESFRPVLHDRFLAILSSGSPVLGMTATMSDELEIKLSTDLAYHNENWIRLDFGNHQLHRSPKKIHCYTHMNPKVLNRAIWSELGTKNAKDVYLIFCSYRSEVDELVNRARRMGLRSLGCVGGEVDIFLKELERTEGKIDCIFSTTTLSHGVNLPEIKKVFINYEVKNYDFWLQMIGRGGRRGSEYEVYTCDSYHADKKELLRNKFLNCLSGLVGI